MIYSPPHFDDPFHASVYDAIATWAARTRPRILIPLMLIGLAAGTYLIVTDWRQAPGAGALLTASAMAGWGLLEQRARIPHTRLTRLSQGLLVLLGTLGAIIGGFGLLFWIMGPAPVL